MGMIVFILIPVLSRAHRTPTLTWLRSTAGLPRNAKNATAVLWARKGMSVVGRSIVSGTESLGKIRCDKRGKDHLQLE